MLQSGSDMNLGKEPLSAEHSGKLGEKNFDGDLASVAKVFCDVDCRHSALADLALDAVSVGKGSGEAITRSGHATIIGWYDTMVYVICLRSVISSPAAQRLFPVSSRPALN